MFGIYAKLYSPCVVEMEGQCLDPEKFYCTAPFLAGTTACIGQLDGTPCCPEQMRCCPSTGEAERFTTTTKLVTTTSSTTTTSTTTGTATSTTTTTTTMTTSISATSTMGEYIAQSSNTSPSSTATSSMKPTPKMTNPDTAANVTSQIVGNGSTDTSFNNIAGNSSNNKNNTAHDNPDHLTTSNSSGLSAGYIVVIVILVLLLLLVVSIYACAHCKAQKERRGQELQHLAHAKAMPETSVNPVFVRPQQTQRRVVVAAMNSLKQYSIPMEELTVNLGVDGEYLEPNAMQMLAYDSLQEGGVLSTVPGANIVLKQATATTPVYATPVQAAASLSLTTVGASQLPGLTPQKDADGYVVDDYTPESGHTSEIQSAFGVGQHASSNA